MGRKSRKVAGEPVCWRCGQARTTSDHPGYCYACARMKSPYAIEMAATGARAAGVTGRFADESRARRQMLVELECCLRELLFALTFAPARRKLLERAVWPCTFIRVSPNPKNQHESTEISDKAQIAACVYCRRDLCRWPNRTRHQNHRPDELVVAIKKHTFACAEEWGWRQIARWATYDTTTTRTTEEAVTQHERCAWIERLQKTVALHVKDPMYGNAQTPSGEVVILNMLRRAPMKPDDPRVVDLEVGFHQLAKTLPWPEYEPFEHGDEKHPHFFRPAVHELEDLRKMDGYPFASDAAMLATAALYGRCGCGAIGPARRHAVNETVYSYTR